MWNQDQHTYEEIREAVVSIILGNETLTYPPNQFGVLVDGVGEVFARRTARPGQPVNRHDQKPIHPHDAELVRDVFWDLFRQGFITLGLNNSNAEWPWFRLSHFGENALSRQTPYLFHDTGTYIALVKREVPDILARTTEYLSEAVATFYAGCLLASCVMLGVAAETEFLRLIDVSTNSTLHGTAFSSLKKDGFIRTKITKFHAAVRPILPALQPKAAFEDLETNLSLIQSVLRIARNEAGHPTSASPQREQVYVFLQLFVPFGRQLMRLRTALA